MKIEIYFDMVCPFCYLGRVHLKKALEKLNLWEQAKIEVRSYELDPVHRIYEGKNMPRTLEEKLDSTAAEITEMLSELKKRGEKVGIDFNFDEAKPTNTLDAHRMLQYAKRENKAWGFSEKIFQAYFEKGQIISDVSVLLDLSEEAGLDREKAKEVLEDPALYVEPVRFDEGKGKALSFDTIPYILIDGEFEIDDSGSVEFFKEKIKTYLATK